MKKVLIGLVVLIVVVIGGAAIALATLDVNKFRDDITRTLTEKTGRTIKIAGPLGVHLSLHGVVLKLADVSIGNPPWASRHELAKVKNFELGVDPLPLLDSHLVIKSLVIDGADILIESAASGHSNLDMKPTKSDAETAALTTPSTAPKAPAKNPTAVVIRVDSFAVTDSRIGMRAENGKVTSFVAKSLKLKQSGDATTLDLDGTFNDQALTVTLKTNGDDLMSTAARPIAVELTFAKLNLKAEGKVATGDKKMLLDSYALSAGSSTIKGKLALDWGGARPDAVGTITGDKIAAADFAMAPSSNASSASAGDTMAPAQVQTRLFNETPLGLDGLKAADAKFDIAFGSVDLGAAILENLGTKLLLKNGELFISPFSAYLGSGKLTGQVHVNGAMEPPRVGFTLNVADVNISDLLHAGNLESFLSGKVNADINIATIGYSTHALASNLNGTINVMGAGGDIISRSSDRVVAGLEALLVPGGGARGQSSLNCMIGRFIASNGVVKDNGILIDSPAATVSGAGGIDLRVETIDMLFRAKPKVGQVSSLIPPLHIGGTLVRPETSISAASVVQNVAGLLLGNKLSNDTSIPDVTVVQGQNACLAALERPPAAATTQPQKQGVVQQLGGKAGELLNGKAGGLLKGILGQ
jgi:hypothetical protein